MSPPVPRTSGRGDEDDRGAGADDRLAAALRRWDIAPVAAPRPAVGGTMNETFIVPTATGPLVLRRHRHRERAIVEREHRVMGHARSHGIPVPTAIRDRSGAYVVEVDGVLHSLFAHAPGQQLPLNQVTDRQARSMGAMLARTDEVLRTAPDLGLHCRRHWPAPDTALTLRRIDALLAMADRPDGDERDRWARERLRGQARWLGQCATSASTPPLPDPPVEEVQPLHGDWVAHNLFFDGDDVCAVIDWDKAERGWPPLEAVRAMDFSFDLEPACSQAFLDGYREHRPLPVEVLDAAAARWGRAQDHDLWLYAQLYESGVERVRPYLRPPPFVPFAERWQATRREVG